jgi:SnoaL-like domain
LGDTPDKEFYGGWLAAFTDAHVEVHDVHFDDDVAVEEGTIRGTHDGVLRTPRGDIPPTGRALSVDYIHVIHYRDGLHARSTQSSIGERCSSSSDLSPRRPRCREPTRPNAPVVSRPRG